MWKELLMGTVLMSAGVGLLWNQPTKKASMQARKFKSNARFLIEVSPAAMLELKGISSGKIAAQVNHSIKSPGQAVKIVLSRDLFEQRVLAWDGKTSHNVRVTLKPKKGIPTVAFTLKSKPLGAMVIANGKPYGLTPVTVVARRGKAVSLQLQKKGYLTLSFRWGAKQDKHRIVGLRKMGPRELTLPSDWSWEGAEKADVAMAKATFSKGIKVAASDPRGNQMIHFASFAARYKLAKWLLLKQKAAVNARNLEGQTPLHLAFARAVANTNRRLYWPHTRFLNLLAEQGALPNALDERAHTPFASALWLMAQRKAPIGWIQSRILGWLLKRGASIDAVDTEGKTPLHYAAYYGANDLVSFLIKQKASLNLKDKNGLTPLDYAVKRNHFSVAASLKQRGGKRSQ